MTTSAEPTEQTGQDHQLPPPEQLLRMLAGTFISQAISVTARLGVADALCDGPLPIDEIAARVNAHPDTLGRLLRAVADLGVVSCLPDGRYALTAIGDLLRTEATPSLLGLAQMLGMPFHRNAWTDLYTSVCTGQPAFLRVHGAQLFDYLAGHPQDAAIFDAAMTSMSQTLQPAFITGYDFGPHSRVVDIGGGHGALLEDVLRANPHLTGVLCETPAVLAQALSRFKAAGLDHRVELTACDFFTEVPACGDLYLLSNVLHDWDDDSAARILGNCRAAARPGSFLLVVEGIVPDDATPSFAKMTDLEMLCLPGGRQRTVGEFSRLLSDAGYRITVAVTGLDAYPANYIEAQAI
jgi:SAM-dependent methyltransferase